MLWSASENIHMVIIATFSVAQTGIPIVSEMSLMPVTRHWLPVENAFDEQLVDRLVQQGRTFRKGLRYNLPAGITVANATLIDTDGDPCSLHIARGTEVEHEEQAPMTISLPSGHQQSWVWHTANEAMPPLPKKRLNVEAGRLRR